MLANRATEREKDDSSETCSAVDLKKLLSSSTGAKIIHALVDEGSSKPFPRTCYINVAMDGVLSLSKGPLFATAVVAKMNFNALAQFVECLTPVSHLHERARRVIQAARQRSGNPHKTTLLKTVREVLGMIRRAYVALRAPGTPGLGRLRHTSIGAWH